MFDLGLNHNPPNLTWLQLLDAELVKGSMSIVDGLVVADEEPAKAADEEKAALVKGWARTIRVSARPI